MQPKDLVDNLLNEEFSEPAGDLTFELIYPVGEEDLDLSVNYRTERTTEGDSDYRPGGSRVKITDVVRVDTGESILKKLTKDQFYDLLEKTQDHHRAYR